MIDGSITMGLYHRSEIQRSGDVKIREEVLYSDEAINEEIDWQDKQTTEQHGRQISFFDALTVMMKPRL